MHTVLTTIHTTSTCTQTQCILLVSSAFKNLVTILAMSKRFFCPRVNRGGEQELVKKKSLLFFCRGVFWFFFFNKLLLKIISYTTAYFQMSKSPFPNFIWWSCWFTNLTYYFKTAALRRRQFSNGHKSMNKLNFKNVKFKHYGIVDHQIPCVISSCLWEREAVSFHTR